MDVTPESIRNVQFREKLRGYHPEDVDAFVAKAAEAIDQLVARVAELERRAGEGASNEANAIEESLRRTLVLAQRTADLAVQEAREEAARLVEEATTQRDSVLRDVEDLRSRLHAEVHEVVNAERERLHADRDALRADVAALEEHLARERERLRIYFSDQLRRLEEQPNVEPVPPMQAPERDAGEAAPVDDTRDEAPAPDAPDEPTDGDGDVAADAPFQDDAEEDAFMASLRQAVSDTAPLGPREEMSGEDGDGTSLGDVDFFGDREANGAPRFGFRRRR